MKPPPLCYPRDMPVDQLRTPELLLATTLRLFAAAWRKPGETDVDWRGGLLAAGLPLWGTAAFDGLFGMVAVAARRPLEVGCTQCRHLSPDEGRFLQTVGLFQHGQTQLGEASLCDWFPLAAGRLAAAPAQALGKALADADLIVPWRSNASPAARYLIRASPGLTLVQ